MAMTAQSMNQCFLSKQRGFSLPSLFIGSIILVLTVISGLKIAPAYFEHYTIEKNLVAIAKESTTPGFDLNQIRATFSKRAQIDSITAINSNDIKIQREGNRIILSAEYTRTIPLVANLSLTIDFKAQSE